ncbi:MAG TPA: hypothetical protein VFM14_01225 [Gemmatimonadales bacterium]|nr:hypothetical protein [Gemmatimonadales bacterium]
MTWQSLGFGIAATAAFALAAGCDRTEPIGPMVDAADLIAKEGTSVKKLSIARCAPGQGGFTIASTNPYYPLGPVGRQWILTGAEDGEAIILQVTVLDQTRVIEGVTTRVIEERETIDGELFEVTWNYFVQAADGTICYYGEDVDIFEEGGISHEGAWCAGGGNLPGIFMPADPHPGMTFQIEVAPDVAEDEGKIVGIGPIEVPFGQFIETIRIREFNPLDGAKDYKIHAAGTGIIVDGPLTLDELNQTSGVPEQPIPTDQACGV